MAKKNPLDRALLYAQVMEEIKIRIAAIDAGTGGMLPGLPPAIVREHCFLQIRLICELIALGGLVAHGDIDAPKMGKLQKEWNADVIMEELTKLHPDFYPLPAMQGRDKNGNHTLTGINPSPLPKEELIKMYGKCGDVLHRGNVKKLLSQKTPIVVHYPDITALAQKINDLLSVHLVVMHGAEKAFICVLRAASVGGAVQVATAEKLLLPPPDGASSPSQSG